MVATKTHELDKQKALHAIHSFLDQFKNSCNQKNAKPADFEKIISHDFQNLSGGKLIGKTIPEFIKRIQEDQKKYSHIEFSNIQDCLISGDKAIVQYNMNRTLQDGKKDVLNVIAIATINDNLITHWSQVSHDTERDH